MRRLYSGLLIGCLGILVGVTAPAWAKNKAGCPPDMVTNGAGCIDTYEASVWAVDPTNTGLIRQIKEGKATLADLTAGATQRGVASDDYGAGCPDTGNGCTAVYAVSIPGVTPSRYLTWFQAAAAARNSGKRLPSNAEWQAAALGTPDTGGADNGTTTCNTDSTFAVASTGSRSACVSDVGAFDMVGNLWEWVADWVPQSTDCVTALFGTGDYNCLAGASTTSGPGALVRGGDWNDGSFAGVFAVNGGDPSDAFSIIGFRCVR